MSVIAAVEDEPHARKIVEKGAEIAGAFDEELHIVHVSDQYQSTERIRRSSKANPGKEVDTEDPKRAARGVAERVATGVAKSFTPVGLVGYPGQEILAYADKEDARYIVIGGRKRSPVGKALFGSVAQEVVLESDRPVVSVRNEASD